MLSLMQQELLVTLVEAERNLPKEERQPFLALATISSVNLLLRHPGLAAAEAYPADLKEFAELGLVRLTPMRAGSFRFDLTGRAYEAYEDLMTETTEPARRLESTIRRLFETGGFQNRHPGAYRKWLQAEAHLWEPETDRHLTTIGHLCREATQEFASSLIDFTGTQGAPPDRAKTQARVQAVLKGLAEKSEVEISFLIALHGYWAALTDLIQRQEHGATKEGRALVWEDGRRVVFHTLLTMLEIDREAAGLAT